MKKYAGILMRIVCMACLSQVISCKKPFDKMFMQIPEDLKFCNIKSMVTDVGTGLQMHWTFTYNDWGDPVNVDREGNAYPQFFFRYDNQHRLTDWFGVYKSDPEFYQFWEHYTYDSQKRVATADRHIFGKYGKDPDPNSHITVVLFYQYDAYGRLVRVADKPGNLPGPAYTFTYDARGNKVLPVDYYWANDYDEFINLHYTNKVWQFIDMEYSLHNQAPAKSYNRIGLPLQFDYPEPLYFLGISFNTAVVEYDCDAVRSLSNVKSE